MSIGLRWTHGKPVKTAAIGVAVLLAGMIPAVGATASTQSVHATLAYSCQGQQVTARVSVTFPSTGTAGNPIQPTGASIALTVPRAVFAGAAEPLTVNGNARLTTTVTQNGKSATSDWNWPASTPAPVPATGDVSLVAAGTVPPVTTEAPGDVVFAPGNLELALTAPKVSATLKCTLTGGHDNLATVLVSEVAASNAPTTPPGKAGKHGFKVGRLGDPGTVPPDCNAYNPPDNQQTACAYLAGFSTVNKQQQSALIGKPEPGYANVAQTGISVTVDDHGLTHIVTNYAGLLNYHGKAQMPPVKGTFTTFGFAPTTASIDLVQVGLMSIDSDLYQDPETELYDIDSVVKSQIIMHVHDVLVNGVPLDVGPSCQTKEPMSLTLSGVGHYLSDGSQVGYTVAGGGPLDGYVTIPAFTHCGTGGDDLDNIFTAGISGPHNYTRLIQGTLCSLDSPDFPCSIPDPGH